MQNTAGKLLERIVARWLAIDLEQRGKLPPKLEGYRRNKETWLNAAVFANDVYEGFQAKAETCAAAIDLEDAYNRVLFKYLMRMLLGLDVHPIIIRWIAAALFQRKVVLRCGSWSSEPMKICLGLPQGSLLSPVLFNVYTVAITDQQLGGRGRTL
jgi:hypothetical protein